MAVLMNTNAHNSWPKKFLASVVQVPSKEKNVIISGWYVILRGDSSMLSGLIITSLTKSTEEYGDICTNLGFP